MSDLDHVLTQTAIVEYPDDPNDPAPARVLYDAFLSQRGPGNSYGRGVDVTEEYRIMLPPWAWVTKSNRIIYGGVTYEVSGDPILVRTPCGPHHVTVELIAI